MGLSKASPKWMLRICLNFSDSISFAIFRNVTTSSTRVTRAVISRSFVLAFRCLSLLFASATTYVCAFPVLATFPFLVVRERWTDNNKRTTKSTCSHPSADKQLSLMSHFPSATHHTEMLHDASSNDVAPQSNPHMAGDPVHHHQFPVPLQYRKTISCTCSNDYCRPLSTVTVPYVFVCLPVLPHVERILRLRWSCAQPSRQPINLHAKNRARPGDSSGCAFHECALGAAARGCKWSLTEVASAP